MRKSCLALSLFFLILIHGGLVTADGIEGLSIHGYISQGYLKSDDNNYLAGTEEGSFEFTEFGFNVSKKFDKLRIGFQLLSRDLGEFGNNDIELDWALGEYHFKDFLGFRVGKIKMPLGLYNHERDVDMLRVPVLLPSSVYDEGSRDLVNTYQGVGIYGMQNISVMGELDYELYYGGADINIDSIYVQGREEAIMSRMPPGSSATFLSNESEYMAGGALRWLPPLEGLRLGVTYHTSAQKNTVSVSVLIPTGPPPAPTIVQEDTLMVDLNLDTMVSSVEYTWYNLTVAAEYSETEMKTLAISLGGQPPQSSKTKSMGWYLQASYRLNDIFSIGAYYSVFYPDKSDKNGAGLVASGLPDYAAWQKEIVPTLKLEFSDHLIIKGEVHFVDGAAQVYNFDNPDGRDEDWTLYALKATYSF